MRRRLLAVFAWLGGWCIYRAALLAKRLGDEHEYRHMAAAISAGNSAGCTDERCALSEHRGVEGEEATDCVVAIKPACGCWVGVVTDRTPDSARNLLVKEWEADGLTVERATLDEAKSKVCECPHGPAASTGQEEGPHGGD